MMIAHANVWRCGTWRAKRKAQSTKSVIRGFTLFELVVTTMLLGVMAGTLVPLLGQAVRRQRETDRRQLAVYEAQNLLEQLAARPWSDLTPEAAASVTLPEACRELLPGARLAVAIDGPDDDGAKRVAVELGWRMRDGVEAAPVRLVTWRYRQPGESGETTKTVP
ncbi:MAG TPA: type II secretion system protein [Planctomycetaceae bacterium]|nr:type II secretion system protein [Planctomycetaceae bacterium]